jgi:hypothetical protein
MLQVVRVWVRNGENRVRNGANLEYSVYACNQNQNAGNSGTLKPVSKFDYKSERDDPPK